MNRAFINVYNVSFVARITNLVSRKAADAVMLFIPYIMQLTAILKAAAQSICVPLTCPKRLTRSIIVRYL